VDTYSFPEKLVFVKRNQGNSVERLSRDDGAKGKPREGLKMQGIRGSSKEERG